MCVRTLSIISRVKLNETIKLIPDIYIFLIFTFKENRERISGLALVLARGTRFNVNFGLIINHCI